MELHEAIALLAEDSLLAMAPAPVAAAIRGSAHVRRVGRGEVVCRHGEPADRLIIPLDTQLRLLVSLGGAPPRSVGQLRQRRSLNLISVLGDRPWDYTAEVIGEGFVLEAPAAPLRAAIAAEPSFSRYLSLVTGRASVREVVRALRSGGAKTATIQQFVLGLEERSFAAGDVVLAADPARASWVLLDEGRCELAVLQRGERIELGALEPGDFYGGSTVLMRMRAVELRAVGPGRALVAGAAELRALAQQDEGLRQALGREKPELVRRVRRALIEVGAEFSKMLAPLSEPSPGRDAAVEDAPPPLGTPWFPGIAAARRMEGPRCTVEEDSGAAAAVSLLRHHGRTLPMSEARRRLRRQPPSLLDLGELLEREGLSTHAARLERPGELARADLPLLTFLGRRVVVVHEIRGRRALLFDPVSGLRKLPLKALRGGWSGAVLSARDVAGFLDGIPSRGQPEARRSRAWASRLHFLRLLTGSRSVLVATMLIGLAILLLGIVAPKLNGVIVDNVLLHGDHHLLEVICLGLILVNASQFVLTAVRDVGLAYLSGLLDHRLSTLLYRHALGVAPSVHGRDRVGVTLSRMNELQRIRDSVSADLVDLVIQICQGLVYLVMVFIYGWQLGLVALAVAPIAYAVVRVGGSRFRALYARAFDQGSRSQSITTEQIEGIATIKAVSGEAQAQTRWERTYVDGVDLQRSMLHTSASVQAALQIVQESARYVGLYLAVRMVLDQQLSAGTMLMVTQYLSGAVKPLFVLSSKLDEIEQLGISFEKLDDLLSHRLEDEGEAPPREPELEGDLAVRDLGFRYDDGPPVLRGVSFEAKRGQTVAIVGRSGCGKTTLARLLQGAMRPSDGEIWFDDHESRTLPLGTIRRNVAMVMQESHLFAGSIRDNIAYGDDRPDEDRVREVARLAAAHEFIIRFPAGYETFLAEGGLGLSGGQRQRVCLARALYRDPRILILDEATSALDAESERAIMANMRDILRGRTAVVIAHRLHTVKNADRILVIDQGKVVEAGTHAELIGGRGLYHALFAQQFNQA